MHYASLLVSVFTRALHQSSIMFEGASVPIHESSSARSLAVKGLGPKLAPKLRFKPLLPLPSLGTAASPSPGTPAAT